MAYTFNCANFQQRDQQFKSWMAQLRVYENGEDVIKDMCTEESPVQEACLACEDKFHFLNDTEKKSKQESNIQIKKDAVALLSSDSNYDWSLFATQPQQQPISKKPILSRKTKMSGKWNRGKNVLKMFGIKLSCNCKTNKYWKYFDTLLCSRLYPHF
jgi:hypothetical protein